MEKAHCDGCGKAKHEGKDLLQCGNCHEAFYHDRACQKNHWPRHKVHCKQVVAARKQQQQTQQQPPIAFSIIETEDKGRCAIALRDFVPGDVVLLEEPALLFNAKSEYLGLLQAYCHAPRQIQEQVLQLEATPPERMTPMAAELRKQRLQQQRLDYLRRHAQFSKVLTLETCQQLWAICECNGFQLFNYHPPPTTSQHAAQEQEQEWMGLFLQGSMVEHSCNPNLTMNTTSEGKLEFIAEQLIAKGDRLSFSYIEGVYEKCLEQRQALLWHEKHFHCQCNKCHAGLDECRPLLLPCTKSNSATCELCQQQEASNHQHHQHVLFWHAQKNGYVCLPAAPKDDTAPNSTTLPTDHALVKAFFATEIHLTEQLHNVEKSLEQGTVSFPTAMINLALLMTGSSWQSTIHSLHWLNVSACQFVSQAASATARLLPASQQKTMNATALLRLSVLALLHNMTWVEQMVHIMRQSKTQDTTAVLRNILYQDQVNLPSQLLTLVTSSLDHWAKTGNLVVDTPKIHVALQLLGSSETAHAVDETYVTADSLLTAFFAGQDLLLAGHVVDGCLMLYQRYQAWFHKLKQPSAENRARLEVLLSSGGTVNPFASLLL